MREALLAESQQYISPLYCVTDGVGEASDSENEDPEDNKSHMLQLSDWITFKLDEEVEVLRVFSFITIVLNK